MSLASTRLFARHLYRRPSTQGRFFNYRKYNTAHAAARVSDPRLDKTVHVTTSRGVNVLHDPLLSKGRFMGALCLTRLTQYNKARRLALMNAKGYRFEDLSRLDAKRWTSSSCVSNATSTCARPLWPSLFSFLPCKTAMRRSSTSWSLSTWRNWLASSILLQVRERTEEKEIKRNAVILGETSSWYGFSRSSQPKIAQYLPTIARHVLFVAGPRQYERHGIQLATR